MAFPARADAAIVLQPGEEPLHFPAPAAEVPPILSPLWSAPVGGNQFDAALFPQALIQPVAVVRPISDHAFWQCAYVALTERLSPVWTHSSKRL
jgi:hypothetical protein